jgi:hypothetical protein
MMQASHPKMELQNAQNVDGLKKREETPWGLNDQFSG